MSRLNQTYGQHHRTPSQSAPSRNREGYPAWQRPVEEQFLQTVLTNTFGSQFYADARELTAESEQVHGAMLKADPKFAAKALVYARNKGFMRSQPVYGLARLAGVDTEAFRGVFTEVIRTPNDLKDFATVVGALRQAHPAKARNGTSTPTQGGSAIKKAVARWLAEKLSPYWIVKYGAEGRSNGYSLADLVRVYHPSFKGDSVTRVAYLLGKLDWKESRATEDAFQMEEPQLYAFERLKTAETDEERIFWITEGRLPHEVATSFAGKSKAVWAAIVPNLPIFALTKHLATLERHGIMEGSVRDQVVAKLSNQKAVAASKMFPYRFLRASEHVRDNRVRDALRDAVDLSFVNVPDIEGRTVVIVDRSGSMGGFIQQAAIFAVAAMKKANGNGRLIQYDNEVEDVPFSMRDSVLTQAARFQARGGTETDKPMRMLLSEKYKADTIILITDEQQNGGTPFFDVFSRYRQQVNPETRLFVMDVSSYRNALTPNQPGIYYVYGWSDTALQFVGLASKGWGSQVEFVRKGVTLAGDVEAEEQAAPPDAE